MTKAQQYNRLIETLDALCRGETDPVALMATISCELYQNFDRFNWVGFYRNMGEELLKIGPYQGGHGCLQIPFSRGVCGKCARERAVQNIPEVADLPYHIACSATTRSEIVVPIFDERDELIAVLDIDSDTAAAFDEVDEINLRKLNKYFLGG
ncbi:MAG: GAF domain-containing protein [Candidatus Latescibacterota bacterium]